MPSFTTSGPAPALAFLRRAAAHATPDEVELYLHEVKIGEEGWALLTEAVSKGNLPDLRKLDAWGCEAFGAALAQSGVRLTHLAIHNNPFGASGLDGLLPAIESGALNELKHLDLHNCRLRELGAFGAALAQSSVRLTKLLVSSNPFDANGLDGLLPAIESGALNELVYLDAHYCALRELPLPLCLLPKLRGLDVGKNFLRSPPQSIFTGDNSAAAARRFAEGVLRASVRSAQFKAAMVGRTMAGKTSLLGGLASGEPSLTREEDRTLAVAWTQQLYSGGFFNRSVEEGVTVLFWDHGGQEDYDAIHHLFWTANALVVLVWDVTRNAEDQMESDVLDWLRQLQASVPGAVVQIVATQADRLPGADAIFRTAGYAKELAQPHIDRLMARVRALEQELAAAEPLHILDALPTSARTMTGIADLQQAMVAASELEQFEHLRTAVPQDYVVVRSCLLRARTQEGSLIDVLTAGEVDPEAPVVRPHTPYSETRELVPHVIPEMFDDAVRWLCALGVLQVQGDLLVLDPVWLGDVLRPLVAHDLLERWRREELQPLAARGLLTPEALDFLWGADEFTDDGQRARTHVPVEQRGDALDLLQKAGAVTRVPNSPDEQFFVSARLPVDAPAAAAAPAALPRPTADNLAVVEVARKLVLRSNRFPPGFPQAAMAACAVRATTLHGWRTGFLCDIDTLLVRVDVGATELRLAVRAPLASLASAWATLEVAQGRIEQVLAARFPGLEYGVYLQCGACLLHERESPLVPPTAAAACTQCITQGAPTIPGLLRADSGDLAATATQLGTAFHSNLNALVATETPLSVALQAELAALHARHDQHAAGQVQLRVGQTRARATLREVAGIVRPPSPPAGS